jgi:HD-GYP domain-containing protein (c-di-GMP phosphodiesterase class II)
MISRTLPTFDSESRGSKLIRIGIALSAERDRDRLLESILLEAKVFTAADGGTLYLCTDDRRLAFAIVRNDSLDVALGGTTGKAMDLPELPLFDERTGKENHRNVATHAALTGETVNIADAYAVTRFDFSGTRDIDQRSGYRSRSFLTVPLKNHLGEVIGVLQLINALDPETGAVIPFDAGLEPLVEALASLAAVALDNQQLIAAQKRLLDSFIELIAGAIDAKSPYTGAHCQRVPELTKMLARAACESEQPPFADFDLTREEWYELHIAAWLHDCGKVTTPEWVVDKATKLETIYNRIHEIRTRFEIAKRDVEIAYLQALVDGSGDRETLQRQRNERLQQLDADFAFVARCNIGGEAMAPEDRERLKRIGAIQWKRTLDDRIGLSQHEQRLKAASPAPPLPATECLIDDKAEHRVPWDHEESPALDPAFDFKVSLPEYKYDKGEIYNLSIERGTLTEEERVKINEHIVRTIVMLEQLPFPKPLARVPEYAGGHHETMIGTGYPRRLSKEDLSIPARIVAVADIFEALTAADRPYKKAKTLGESLRIMAGMSAGNHIDPDLFRLFLESGVYKDYAERFLSAEQIDPVDIAVYL